MQAVPRSKFGLLLTAATAVGVAVPFALPWLADGGKLAGKLTERLAGWTGGDVVVAGPVDVSFFPTIVVEAREVRIARPSHLPAVDTLSAKVLRLEVGRWSMLFGAPSISRLSLVEPLATLADGASEASGRGAAGARLLESLRDAPVARVSVVDGALAPAGADGPTVAGVNGDIDLADTSAIEVKGSFAWRGETVAVSLAAGKASLQGDVLRAPVTLAVSAPNVAARLTGDATIADGVQAQGQLDLSVPRLRAFADWLGLSVPEGPGLGELKAVGPARLGGGRVAFDQVAFSLDGNAALGALALDLAGPRPSVAGTLALQQFSLAPYRAPAAPPTAAAADSEPVFEPALLRLVDLDLRLSTARIVAAPVELGETALSVRLHDGALAADYSVLAICGGRADGRLEAVWDPASPRWRLAANGNEIDARRCIEAFAAPSPIEGRSRVALDLAASGATTGELLASLEGAASLAMGPGQAALDLGKMFAQAKRGALQGWDAVRGNPTRFDSLAGQCALSQGLARCASLRLGSGPADVTGRGTLALTTGEMDWRLSVANKASGRLQRVGELVSSLLDDVVVEGSWSEPTFRLSGSDASEVAAPRRFALRTRDVDPARP